MKGDFGKKDIARGLWLVDPALALPLSRFHVATLAFQRAKQLHHGARPRVNGAGRQSWRVALLEVEADQVGWYLP